ncbi:MerR family DNA-binding protein [Beijerinckia mobilis]|uniref:MerR family DNA-binding protein n=1 Tax=Beijerinckia mobilis TaxID=231434 RepID=UPI00055574D8|nr:MerR family DNA-binding protein [Beijerinckia mobilis]
MKISEASRKSGVSVKMIRYYEAIGILQPIDRLENGYRLYSDIVVDDLKFISRARNLDFSLETISALLSLWRDKNRSSSEAHTIAARHLQMLESRIAGLQEMAELLRSLITCCPDDDKPSCPILDCLAGKPAGGDNQVMATRSE